MSAHSFLGVLAVAGAMLGLVVFRVLFMVLVERSVMGFRHLKPQYCSIYDPYFWRHERLWKLLAVAPLNGTPLKPLIWRMMGVKVGKRLYDAGLNMPEKTLVTIGDNCTFNEGGHIQGHSMEDGTFKSGYVVIGNGCSLGVESLINYGVTMRDGSTLGADALLMKGEDVPENATYTGNPAREVTSPVAHHPLTSEVPGGARRGGPRHRGSAAASGGLLSLPRGAHGNHGTPGVHGTHRASRTGTGFPGSS